MTNLGRHNELSHKILQKQLMVTTEVVINTCQKFLTGLSTSIEASFAFRYKLPMQRINKWISLGLRFTSWYSSRTLLPHPSPLSLSPLPFFFSFCVLLALQINYEKVVVKFCTYVLSVCWVCWSYQTLHLFGMQQTTSAGCTRCMCLTKQPFFVVPRNQLFYNLDSLFVVNIFIMFSETRCSYSKCRAISLLFFKGFRCLKMQILRDFPLSLTIRYCRIALIIVVSELNAFRNNVSLRNSFIWTAYSDEKTSSRSFFYVLKDYSITLVIQWINFLPILSPICAVKISDSPLPSPCRHLSFYGDKWTIKFWGKK